MRIRLASRGGWSAGLKLPPLTVDTEALPLHAASEGEALAVAAERALVDAPTVTTAKARAPEAMTHEVTVEYDDRNVTLRGSDVSAAPDFQALVDWVRQHA